MKHSDRARQVFKEELSWISDQSIVQFVLDVFDVFGHDMFWDRPASLSGKYHPQMSLGKGGLVRHVRLACYWGLELNRALLMEPKEKQPAGKVGGKYGDVVIAALILHDLMKEGDPKLASEPSRMGHGGKSLIVGCHGVDLANAIFFRMLGQKATPEQILILYGIACHMGIWTIPAKYIPTNIEGDVARAVATVVAQADYCASRKVDGIQIKLNQEVPSV